MGGVSTPDDPGPPPQSLAPSSTRSGTRLRIGAAAAVLLLLAAVAAAILVWLVGPRGHTSSVSAVTAASAAPTAGRSSAAKAAPTPEAEGVLVHVAGAVQHPGLYRLQPGSRVVDAIAAAGGFDAKANQAGVNLARELSDGEQLVVPKQGEPVAAAGGGAAEGAAGGAAGRGAKVNVNTADATQLETLPRIGPALAQRIVAWRTSHGNFDRIEDLMSVSGIGQKTFDGFKDQITV